MVNFTKILVVSIFFISNLSYSGWFGNSKCDEIESLLYLVTKEKDNGLKSKDLLKELRLYFKNKEVNGADFVKNEFRMMIVIGVFASKPYHQDYSLSNSKAKSATKWAINRQVEMCKEGIFDKQFNLLGVDSLDIDDLVLNAYPNGQAKQEIEYDENKLVLTRWYKSGQKSSRSDFKNDKLHGKYELWNADGDRVEVSNYKNDKLHGKSELWHENGQILQISNYINGKLDGKYELWNADGDRVEVSNYKNDKLHGKRELWHENGEKLFTIRTIDGEMDGEYISWYDNGEKAQKYFIKNGMLNGLHTLWYDNGQKAYIFNYLNDKLDRENKMVIYAWKKNGDRLIEMEVNPKTLDGFLYAWHKNGQKMGEDGAEGGESYSWYENGQKHIEQEYDPEMQLEYDNDGEYLVWHENGEELFSGSIIKDKIHGDFVFYYDNGKVKYKGVAINGKIKGRLKSFYSNGKVMNTDWEAAYRDIWKDVVTSPSEKGEIFRDEIFTNYHKLDDKVSKMQDEAVKYIENFKLLKRPFFAD